MAQYLTADIHGSFTRLWQRLQQMGFNPDVDVLYSLGDLVNRGDESVHALEWLKKPWFKAIQGNHEAMLIRAWQRPEDSANLDILRSVNGAWWFSLNSNLQEQLANGLASLPLCREFEVAGKKIGLVHADVPEGSAWPDFVDALNAQDACAIDTAQWSRWRWKTGVKQNLNSDYIASVEGIDWVFVGHSPVQKPTKVGNVVFMDCGLWRGNNAAVICIDDWLKDNPAV